MTLMARAATTSDVFNAIAEPQRREILVLLRAGERPVTELAQELGMTQPGASNTCGCSGRSGWCETARQASSGLYGLDARELRSIPRVDSGFERFWNESFDRLDATCRTSSRQNRRNEEWQRQDGTRRRSQQWPTARIVISRLIMPTGAGVRGVHRSPAPVAMVGTGGVHHHHAGVRVPRRRGVGLRDARTGRDGLPGVDLWTEITAPERMRCCTVSPA